MCWPRACWPETQAVRLHDAHGVSTKADCETAAACLDSEGAPLIQAARAQERRFSRLDLAVRQGGFRAAEPLPYTSALADGRSQCGHPSAHLGPRWSGGCARLGFRSRGSPRLWCAPCAARPSANPAWCSGSTRMGRSRISMRTTCPRRRRWPAGSPRRRTWTQPCAMLQDPAACYPNGN